MKAEWFAGEGCYSSLASHAYRALQAPTSTVMDIPNIQFLRDMWIDPTLSDIGLA